ncbi:type VI secretion system contractile sheath small subunit [Candidatus Sneabacter namystus]|uniref:Type VI secretion system contractile sheath small subunit n=1 Tax=Candidatus Sneabacter namystus TaxID=2601646 RepID=A0A5C0UK38_9RICK|nr:type VI secretion system contractile sheath small subunit [Candidatus Sneabacter namystus]QEK39913.1 type VI secretion system contractile sheath small subunit [Candidatus Sneabacter namystus]
MAQSIYDKIKKVRKPRVQISYEVEDGGATVKKELPFVVGVLGDFSGKPVKPLKALKKRKFVNIHGENFNEVMSSMTPGVEIRVENKVTNDGTELPVKLAFNSMDDFSPGKVAQGIEPLKKLMDIRAQLKELLSKAERSEKLEAALEKVLSSEENLKSISEAFKDKGDSDADGDQAPDEEKPTE